MKKKLIFAIGVLLFFGFVSVNCSAQSSNNDQRIVGTWIFTSDNVTITLVFNANGSGSIDGANFTYGLSVDGELMSSYTGLSGKIHFSPDGRTLFLGSNPSPFRKR
jgi:hypothetical protein